MLQFKNFSLDELKLHPATLSLYPSQQNSFCDLVQFCLTKPKPYKNMIRLEGYAGTGKTYVLTTLVKYLSQDWQCSIVIAAPTHTAKKNVQSMLGENLNVQVVTLAQLLGLKPLLNEEIGEIQFKRTNGTQVLVDPNLYDIIIVDESSMVNRKDFDTINEVIIPNKPIVFVGDPEQIPPVKEKKSKVYLEEMPSTTLKEVVRYSGEIAKVAEEIRLKKIYRFKGFDFSSSRDGTIQCIENEIDFLDKALDFFTSKNFKENLLYSRIACWTNERVDYFNRSIRSKIYGVDAPPYVIGERLLAKRPVTRKNGKKDVVLFNNSELFEVIGFKDDLVANPDYPELYHYDVLVKVWGKSETGSLRVITPYSKPLLDKYLADLEVKEQEFRLSNPRTRNNPYCRERFSLMLFYDSVQPVFGSTVHKLQGSTIEMTMVYLPDINRSPDRQSLTYTALTRTAQSAIIFV